MAGILGLIVVAGCLLSTAVAVPAPEPTAAARLEERAASCTFSGSNGASLASMSKSSCATIVLSAVAVPSGTTLDLTGLNSGTQVKPQTHALTHAER